MTLLVSAPASTANVGSGFDCVAVALDLRNEVELEPGDGAVEIEGEGADELPRDDSHLALRAFSLFADPGAFKFRFTNRIPLERGLGSSAAAIAVGLAAGQAAAGKTLPVDELVGLGAPLEGHADNLAAALAGGVTLTSGGRVMRLADEAPGEPIALVPNSRVNTRESRSALPATVPFEDAAYTSARAAYLGAALASGSPELFAEALDDRLHEPYRAANAPLLAEVRGDPPPGALGATLSGSGPTVIVWARPEAAVSVAAELTRRHPDVEVMRLKVTPTGAGPV
ncbi:MAG TPA: homoserine kinase [Gaiellaceae bacterium]